MSQDPDYPQPAGQGPKDASPSDDPAVAALGEILDAQLPDLVAYCRALTSREEDAVSAAHAALDGAESLLTDPDQLRAWLLGLARREAVGDAEPPAQEILDLVYRLGIQPEDLSSVLGIPPDEADQLLAAAEEQYRTDNGWDHQASADSGGRDDNADQRDGQPDLSAAEPLGELLATQLAGVVTYCRALTGREDDAVRIAHAVLGLAESLLTDSDRLRAWLFALARREGMADAAPDAQEILDLVHRHGVRAEDLPIVLGIAPAKATELLAVAEDSYALSAFDSDYRAADSWQGDRSDDESRWTDRPIEENLAVWDDNAFWADGPGLDDDTGTRGHGLEPAGRHAAPPWGGPGIRERLARAPVRAAAATAIVVAVIGVSVAYLAAANSPPPSQASQRTNHHPSPAAQSPATTPSSIPTAAPTQSTSPSQPVTVVQPPAPAATSPRTSPRPSPKPSPPPSPSPSQSSSPSPSPSPSPA